MCGHSFAFIVIVQHTSSTKSGLNQRGLDCVTRHHRVCWTPNGSLISPQSQSHYPWLTHTHTQLSHILSLSLNQAHVQSNHALSHNCGESPKQASLFPLCGILIQWGWGGRGHWKTAPTLESLCSVFSHIFNNNKNAFSEQIVLMNWK